jgi:uncharacterized SAM-binding protein YcdF (DUF218 family)
VILLSGGVSFGWQLRQVVKLASDATVEAPSGLMLLVLGIRLRRDMQPAPDFTARLERAYRLCCEDPERRLLVLGGLGSGAAISEAACGRDYLLARGLSEERVLVEEASRHTLENLRNARELLKKHGSARFVLITSRYHLMRSEAIAKGLGMKPQLCGAEDRFVFSLSHLPRLLIEAYHVHWYKVGSFWAHFTGSRKSLARTS